MTALAFVAGLLWFALVAFAFNVFPGVPAVAPLVAGIALASVVIILIQSLSSGQDWGDSGRFAMVFGGISASMLAGYWASGTVLWVDLIGKTIFDVVALLLLLYLGMKIRGRTKVARTFPS
jgi:hypothetical protein